MNDKSRYDQTKAAIATRLESMLKRFASSSPECVTMQVTTTRHLKIDGRTGYAHDLEGTPVVRITWKG